MTSSEILPWRAASVLGVADVQGAVDFYTSVLGFECGAIFAPPEHPAVYAIIDRPGVQFHLQIRESTRTRIQGDCDVYLYVPDADAMHDSVKAAGGNVIRGLMDEEYGLRDFEMADPWDNRLVIGHFLESFSDEPRPT